MVGFIVKSPIIVSKYNQKQKSLYFTFISLATSIMLNQTYQHKKGPPKMVKDLKYGADAHLRQSLLDITEIQNLNRIFIGRKTHYRIDEPKNQSNPKYNLNLDETEPNPSKQQFVLSPQQNLQLIKRQRLNNKMKDKLNMMFRQQEVRKYKLRKPIVHNMLQEFKESFRVEDQPKYREALKNSEKQLSHIKINSKKRISSHYMRTDTSQSRSKFLSIKTSKPTVNKNYFPTFGDFVKGKYQLKEKPLVTIDIGKIESFYDTMMITEPILHKNTTKKGSRDEYGKMINRQSNSNTPILGVTRVINQSPIIPNSTQADEINEHQRCVVQPKTKSQYQSTYSIQQPKQSRAIRSKSAFNPNISFNRSEQSSRKIISAMQSYYVTKRQKNQECDTIVEYMRKDRPLTSHLRRKNYKVIGSQSIQQLDNYRQKTQDQRVKLLQKNYYFYISLLKIFQHCNEKQIFTSLKILNRLKEFFESEYVLFIQDVPEICQLAKGDREDFGVKIIQENLNEYAKKHPCFTVNNQEDYEVL